jgi:hypothetical protein
MAIGFCILGKMCNPLLDMQSVVRRAIARLYLWVVFMVSGITI